MEEEEEEEGRGVWRGNPIGKIFLKSKEEESVEEILLQMMEPPLVHKPVVRTTLSLKRDFF